MHPPSTITLSSVIIPPDACNATRTGASRCVTRPWTRARRAASVETHPSLYACDLCHATPRPALSKPEETTAFLEPTTEGHRKIVTRWTPCS